jgi:hypothetical protein
LNKAIEICQRNELWALIRKISTFHGGDEDLWLREFAKVMVEKHGFEKSLECFKNIASQLVEKSVPHEPVQKRFYELQPPFNKELK